MELAEAQQALLWAVRAARWDQAQGLQLREALQVAPRSEGITAPAPVHRIGSHTVDTLPAFTI